MYITQSARRALGQESRCVETGALSACLALVWTSPPALWLQLALSRWNLPAKTPAQLTKKTRDCFKMRRRKRLCTPPPLTQQSTTTNEGILSERDLKTRLRVSTMKVKGSFRMGRAARERVSRKKNPRPSPGDPPLGGVTEGWAFSLRSEGWKLRTRRPSSWTLT